jgi:hypothetical protein
MAYTKTGGTCRVPPTSQKPKTIVGHDRLKWRHADDRWFLFHGNNRNPLISIEPDSKYAGMYRLRFQEGGLSDMVNLTRAKDAAIALALRSLNSGAQEAPQAAAYVPKKGAKVAKVQGVGNPLCEAPNGFLAEDRS